MVPRITIATGKARGNEKNSIKTAVVCLMEGRYFFATKPDEMGMQYFQELYVLEKS